MYTKEQQAFDNGAASFESICSVHGVGTDHLYASPHIILSFVLSDDRSTENRRQILNAYDIGSNILI